MLGRQAKIVSPATLRRMLAYARRTRQPKRDTVIVLLSVKAGLRACEIAGLQWSMVMTDNGKMSDVIDIRDTIAKRGSGRRIGAEVQREIFTASRHYDDFAVDNDPYGEHDFGRITAQGHEILFKIDYYDQDFVRHSPDSSDPAVTHRVLTVMLAEDY